MFLLVIPIVKASILDDIYNGFLGLFGLNNPVTTTETTTTIPQETIIRGDNCNDYYNLETKEGVITLGKFPDYVRYNGECTDIKTIPSLKNVSRFVKVYLERDSDYEIEIEDFNLNPS